MKKLKKIFGGIAILISNMYNKAFGSSKLDEDFIRQMQTLYGIPRSSYIARDTTNFMIPFVFFIGIIVYFKKSTKSLKRKLITMLIVSIVALYFWLDEYTRRGLVIPILFIMGTFIYFVESQSKIWKKILVTIIVFVLIMLLGKLVYTIIDIYGIY